MNDGMLMTFYTLEGGKEESEVKTPTFINGCIFTINLSRTPMPSYICTFQFM